MRIVIISDSHCGHRSGLTPPGWQYQRDASTEVDRAFGAIQRAMWDWYSSTIDSLQPIDVMIGNGDMIEGKGYRSGGTELIRAGRDDQCDIAQECIEYTKAKKVYMTYGTPYHVGTDEDWEGVLAANLNAKIGSHEWYDADGVIIDCKHKVSSSIIPHGRNTGPNRDALWNALWAERGLQPNAHILIRSHVHYHVFSGNADRLVMTTPCLQAKTKYGSRQCVGTIDIGLISIDIEGGEPTWKAHLMDLQFMAAQAVKL